MEEEEPTPQAVEEERRRAERTKYLLIAGAVTLLLPLLGVAFLRGTDPGLSPGFTGGRIFGKRGSADKPLTMPAATPAAPRPVESRLPTGKPTERAPDGSSLNFLKSDNVYYPPQEEKKEEPKAPPPPEPPEAEEPAPLEKKPAKGKKPFTMPKLKPAAGSTSFSDFKGKQPLGKGAAGKKKPAAHGDDVEGAPPDIQEMLKSIQGSD